VAKNLQILIESKQAKVCVMGVGYVGLPLSIIIAQTGYQVVCGEVSKEKIDLLNRGLNPLSELKEIDGNELERLVKDKRIVASNPSTAAANTDIKIICVPTPMFSDKSPNLTNVKSAAKTIGESLKRGDLVVTESSVSPGMTRKVICKVLEENSGLTAGQDFHVVTSPERIDPGNSKHTIEKIPKIIGGIDGPSLSIGKSFYQKFIGKIVAVSSLEAAETTKMLENAYRALNIGFINEFAKFCDTSGIDIMEVVKAASTKWSFQPHYPGIGVGGHCITKDPYYLISAAEEAGVELRTLRNALWSNESMPHYVFNLLKKGCEEIGLELKTAKVALFGIAYKGDTRDIRNSPALIFQNILESQEIATYVYDPLFTEKELKGMRFKPFNPETEYCDIVVIGCDHSQFKTFDFNQIKSLKFIIDGRNILPKQDIPVTGIGTNLNLRR